MPVYTVTSYLYVGDAAIEKPFDMTIKDDDKNADWFGKETGEKEQAEINGEVHTVIGTGVHRFTFETEDGDEVTEDIVCSSVDGVGWVLTPSEDSKFDTGSHITEYHGWQEYGTEYEKFTCFTRGCQIATPTGPTPVEYLQIGDMVSTLDHGPQPILWKGASIIKMAVQIMCPNTRPVIIPAHAFDEGVPNQNTALSPPHRVVLKGVQLTLNHGVDQAFAPAKALIGHNNIYRSAPVPNLIYYHILLPAHEVILANGLPSESFFPGGEAVRMMDTEARRGLFKAHPSLAADPTSYGSTARLCLTKIETQALQFSADHAIA